MLTRKQTRALFFIERFIKSEGFAPSLEEIAAELGLGAKSNAHRIISRLVDLGYLRRLAKRHRAIEVIRLPENHTSEVRQ